MRILIHYIKRKLKSGENVETKEINSDLITVGRGTDEDIYLSGVHVALKHAEISVDPKGNLHIKSKSIAGIRIDGHTIDEQILHIGSTINIGEYQLTIKKPPSNYDHLIEVNQFDAYGDKDKKAKRFQLSTQISHFNKRYLSWMFFLLVFIGFLVFPMSGHFFKPLRDSLRDIWLFSDNVWNTGGLSSSHRAIATECNICHKTAFISVKDSDCKECHKNMYAHVDKAVHQVTMLETSKCAYCHQEHNSSLGLKHYGGGLCIDCHKDIKDIVAKTELRDVSDFGNDHPEFMLTLLRNEGKDSVRVLIGDKKLLKESSGLRFDHKIHLAKKGIRGAKGNVKMSCVDCHQPDPGGIGFVSINMEKHCQSCHRLEFDAHVPDRELPHSDIQQLMNVLEDFYMTQALKGGYRDVKLKPRESSKDPKPQIKTTPLEIPDIVSERRRPGVELTVEESLVATAWAKQKWRHVAEEVIQYRSCSTCHIIDVTRNDPPDWRLAPVTITDHWMKSAQFNHKSHRTQDCVDCHKMTQSEDSEDVMIPGIANCRKCHGGSGAKDRVASTCISCHKFHQHEIDKKEPINTALNVGKPGESPD
ncbi:MAG: FHA domain-containing protein [Proteobacteria bacterium]|nr:FHA domain-containing protein [Pseudomonadota bacterium]